MEFKYFCIIIYYKSEMIENDIEAYGVKLSVEMNNFLVRYFLTCFFFYIYY